MSSQGRRLQIAVCGCGPAGLAAALALHRSGHRVRLFERFATPKPLGSGLMLQPTGLGVLRYLGLYDQVLTLGHRIERLFGRVHPSGRVVLDVRYEALGAGEFALAVHRAAVFGTLFDAVQRENISIEGNFEIAELDRAADQLPILIDSRGRRHGPFDLLVDGLGARSPLTRYAYGRLATRKLSYGALWTTLPWQTGFMEHALEQRYERASVMIGVLPIGRRPGGSTDEAAFFWSLKAEDYDGWRQGGVNLWKERVLQIWPETEVLLRQISHAEQFAFARYAHQALARPIGKRIAFVGDAARATSPQLGQGANMALLDAFTLADSLEHYSDLDAALESYWLARRVHASLYQAMSWLFTPFYQSDSRILPVLRDLLFPLVSRTPLAPKLLAALVGGWWASPTIVRKLLESKNPLQKDAARRVAAMEP
jgi:salicylate hydroxylase